MLTKIEIEVMEAVKSFCRRESKKTYVKTFEFACDRKSPEECDATINEWVNQNHITIVSIQHSVVAYPIGHFYTYTLLYHK